MSVVLHRRPPGGPPKRDTGIPPRRLPPAGTLAFLLILAAVAKYCAWDTLEATSRYWLELHGVVANRVVFAGLALAGLCLVLRYLGEKLWVFEPVQKTRVLTFVLLPAMACVVAAWTGTFEIVRVFHVEPAKEKFTDPLFVMQVTLSVFWATHATLCLLAGFARRLPAVRYVGLGLFAITLIKLMIVDLAKLETLYRIASFVVLGVFLMFASLLYQRLSARLTENSVDAPRGV